MLSMTKNAEDRARAQCTIDVDNAQPPVENPPAVVERLWPVVALEIQEGVADSEANPLPNDMAQRIAEHDQLLP